LSSSLEIYISELLKWNSVHKLTNYKNRKTILENIEDSIKPIEYLELSKVKSAVDIGSGAGFPAIFLAMKLENIEFTLLEPLGKKFSFLNYIATKLKLKNVRVLKKRVEELRDEKFDLITSRAVTDTKSILELSKHLTKPSSQILLYKGSSVQNELDKNIECKIYTEANRNYLII
jgi:16S rRNA (guanine527-N7)-methyltransferase